MGAIDGRLIEAMMNPTVCAGLAAVAVAAATSIVAVRQWRVAKYFKHRFNDQRKTLDKYAADEAELRERQMKPLMENQAAYYKQNEEINELKKWMRKNYSENERAEHQRFVSWVECVTWLLSKERKAAEKEAARV